jgi:hypothetical protein
MPMKKNDPPNLRKKPMKEPTFEEISHQGKTIAIILHRDFSVSESRFFSPADFSQQLGFLVHRKGHTIPAHFHKKIQRRITLTQEVLLIKKGEIQANLYSSEQEFLTSRLLRTGDIIFLCSGGHGFTMLQDSEIVEVKQGPYSGRDSDKENFVGIENDSGQ